jgi:hypothetical protein
VVLWVALIYTTIPFVRRVQSWYDARWDKALIGDAVMIIMVLAGVGAVLGLRRLGRRLKRGAMIWLIAITALYVWWAASLRTVPEEAIHLLEYGVLGSLLYRALRPQIHDFGVFIAAAMIGVFVGTVDEVIQWITPERFYDFRDIFLNSGSCALALVGVSRVEPVPGRPSIGSTRRLLRLAVSVLLLFTVCLSMTPQRVQRLAQRFPDVTFLQSPANEMSEYGYRHEIPGVGRFKSRLTIRALEVADSTRWAEAAAIIDRYPGHRYAEFFRDYPSHRDPFVYEVRVHMFSRDAHLTRRNEQPEGSDGFIFHATVALREHQILERHFTNTLRNSRYRLATTALDELRRQQDPDLLWTSQAGRHLITWISEAALRVLLLACIVALVAVDVLLGMTSRTRVTGGR